MSRFFETIYVQNHTPRAIEYHNRRVAKTLKDHFNIETPFKLEDFIKAPNAAKWKCKVLYSKRVERIDWFVYKERAFRSFKLISANISYEYKFEDRSELDKLFEKRGLNDDVIIIKNGLVTDTTIANIAIFLDNTWLTPKEPLLRGTTRERYLEQKRLIEEHISVLMLKSAQKIALLNALLDFYVIENPIFED